MTGNNINKIWWSVLLVGLLPLFVLMIQIAADALGANPIEAIHIRLGDWALRFLCLTLAITPLQTLTKWRGMADFRQLFGIYSWFYASLHVLAYLAMDQAWQWSLIGMDLLESRYIWFGLIAYVILLLLALTTTKAAKKALGKRWKKLHRWIYCASLAAVMHYFWQLKGNLLQPGFYLIIIAFLLGFRFLVWFKDRQISRLMIPVGRRHLS
ncbi:MAG: sulfite oxidase heme-binding subunit YedZ [Gammaproteobacteria bacterium]